MLMTPLRKSWPGLLPVPLKLEHVVTFWPHTVLFQACGVERRLELFPLVWLGIPRLHKTQQSIGLLGIPPVRRALETPAGQSSVDLRGCLASSYLGHTSLCAHAADGVDDQLLRRCGFWSRLACICCGLTVHTQTAALVSQHSTAFLSTTPGLPSPR